MSIITEKIVSKITSLKNNFELNKNIIHQGIKGTANEDELSNLIAQVIPKKFQISKGVIENAKGEQSNETDFFIYDDEILPPYLHNSLAFVPIEATRYIFEVKSTLNSTELKTSISKFSKYAYMGGSGATVLFSFDSDIKGSEIERYKKNDNKFFTYPKIMVLCVSTKGYYFKHIEEKFLKDILSIDNFLKNLCIQNRLTDNFSNLENFIKSSQKLTINDIKYESIKFKVHTWIGVEDTNCLIELSLLSGISNTLCKERFGNYLLHNKDTNVKVYSVCYEDMWGNISYKDFDPNGIKYNFRNVSFEFISSSEKNEIIFKLNDR